MVMLFVEVVLTDRGAGALLSSAVSAWMVVRSVSKHKGAATAGLLGRLGDYEVWAALTGGLLPDVSHGRS